MKQDERLAEKSRSRLDYAGMFKLGLTLALFAAAACVGLAFVYTGTSEIIDRRQQADLEAALREFFPRAEDFTDISGEIAAGTLKSPDPSVTFENAYEVWQGGALAGAAFRVARGSYGGTLRALIGVAADSTIAGVRILEHQDTPGLGANAASSSYFVDRPAKLTFYGQFTGKSVSDPFEVKQDLIAVTASTVTSRAVALAVKAAGAAAAARLGGSTDGQGEEK
jgi:electron transport complex protein RnfG